MFPLPNSNVIHMLHNCTNYNIAVFVLLIKYPVKGERDCQEKQTSAGNFILRTKTESRQYLVGILLGLYLMGQCLGRD